MRTLQWQKIPANKVVGKPNIWTMGGQLFNGYVSKMDYEAIDDLFCVNVKKANDSKNGVDSSDGNNVLERKKKETTEINLLDGKRSLNVNIFLKQFRMPNEDIVQLLRAGDSKAFGAEKLRNLQKILPAQEEVDMFRSFDGDASKLGGAEKFFLTLMDLPNYRLRVEGLLIKEEFNTNLEWIGPSINSIIEAAKDIKENKNLQELLYLVLLAGNYLNAGNYAGDAAGFKLSSLLKLTETRANKPRMNLMHYVVMQAEEKNPKLLNVSDEMKFLKDASQASVENLTTDITSLDKKLKSINSNIDSVGSDFKKQMQSFLVKANIEIDELKEDLKDVESLRMELADFFCEDVKTFKLEETFKIFQTFCERFNKAKFENEQRREHERKMEARRQQKEAEMQKKRNSDEIKTPDGQMVETEDGKGSIVQMLLADVRCGFKKFGDANFSVTKVQKVNLDGSSVPNADDGNTGGFVRQGYGRRSMRSRRKQTEQQEPETNQNGLDNADSESTCSSIEDTDLNQKRTRRSYAVDTDDTLFDFLMQSGPEPEKQKQEGNFERVGSLRRRSQNRRQQRGGNLSADLYDRERAASPSIEKQNKDSQNKERPKSDIIDGNIDFTKAPEPSSLRRVRSMYEKSSNSDSASSLDSYSRRNYDSRADRPKRLFDPNNNKNDDFPAVDRAPSPGFRSDDPTRRSARWRSGVPDPSPLQPIHESARLVTPTKEVTSRSESPVIDSRTTPVSKDDTYTSVEKKNRETMERRFSQSNLDHNEIRKVLDSAPDIDSKNQSNELPVSVSVRSKINKRWHSDLGKTDIDKVLKTIEDTGRQIDNIPVRAQAVVTASVKAEPIESASGEPAALKEKRNKRKQRSTLSMDDIHAAFKKNDEIAENDSYSDTGSSKDNNQKKPAPPPPKSPSVPPRRSRTNSDGKIEIIPHQETEKNEKHSKETMSKAAKLAAKKRFRDQRFGDNNTPSQKAMLDHSQGRWKSNVEKDSVDQALKDLVNKNNMSRSKSYDEAVARRAMSEGGEFSLQNDEKRSSLRNSASKLFLDGRRNGRVFASDDSDVENCPDETSSPKRPSSTRSDSPKSGSSRLSIKSTNTSTETLRELQSDADDSPAHSRKNSFAKTNGLDGNSVQSQDRVRPGSTPSPSFSNKIYEDQFNNSPVQTPRSQVESSLSTFESRVPFDENDDLPQAKMLKWRKKRDELRRQSFYDNVQGLDMGNMGQTRTESAKLENTSYSPRSDTSLTIIHKPQGSNELHNEIGSRCSYASSSDSARDEGFETMSGTVSQRTSLSSTLESELTVTFPRKTDVLSKSHLPDSKFDQEIIVGNARDSVSDMKKKRTESWTEAVAGKMENPNKDSSIDSSMEEQLQSPDSGHETMKDETWGDNSDMESTIKEKRFSIELNDGSRPLSPASSLSGSQKKVPSYMRGTSSSSKKTRLDSAGSDVDRRRSNSTSNTSTPVSRNVRLSRNSTGLSNQSLNKAKGGSNTSLVSINSTASDMPTKRRVSHGPTERPSSVHSTPGSRSSTPFSGSRSTTPQSSSSRTSTPSSTRVASKPAAHASSTIGTRQTPAKASATGTRTQAATTPRTTKSHAPPPPRSKTPNPTPTRSVTPNPTRTRSMTPNPTSNRPTTPLDTTLEETPVPPTRFRRTQSLRITASKRPVYSSLNTSQDAPEKTTTPRRSFMSPTAASKAKVDPEDESPPPTPPPRRSKDTDSLPKKDAVSPLKRHSSLRLPGRSANKTGRESPSVDSGGNKPSGENKLRGFMQKIGGHSSKVRPEADSPGKLATVAESASENDTEEGQHGKEKSSLKKILGLKGKEKTVRKSTDTLKSDTPDKKRKPVK